MSTQDTSLSKGLSAIILAAGKGTRMQSDLPKVAHEVADAPMVRWVVDSCFEAGCSRVVIVVGHRREVVEAVFDNHPRKADIVFTLQAEQLGTGHAVVSAADAYANTTNEDVFVLCGDGPLIRTETLAALLNLHREQNASGTLATATLEDATGYGRVVRTADGKFQEIVEQKNATQDQLAIREVNPSYYLFDAEQLFEALKKVERNELTGEYYVTDVPALMLAAGLGVEVIDAVPADDVLSINTPEQLAVVDGVLRARLAAK